MCAFKEFKSCVWMVLFSDIPLLAALV